MRLAVTAPPEQRVVLRDTSWETYERLLTERGERAVPRLTYDRGVLEIMSLGRRHERLDRLIGLLVGILAEAWEVDVVDLGHLTSSAPSGSAASRPTAASGSARPPRP